MEHGAIKYKNGTATLTYETGDSLIMNFSGSEHANNYTLEGKVFFGTGLFKHGPQGTLSAHGHFNRLTGAFTINLKIHLTKY